MRIGTPCVQDAGVPNTYRRTVARTCTHLLYASICKAPTSTSQVGTLFIITHAHARARNTQISMEDLVRPRPRFPGSGLYLEYYSQEQPGATRSSQGAAREQPRRPGISQGAARKAREPQQRPERPEGSQKQPGSSQEAAKEAREQPRNNQEHCFPYNPSQYSLFCIMSLF